MWMAVKRGIVVAIGLLIQILLTLFIYLKFGEFISIIQVVYGLLSIIIVLMIIKYSKRLSSDLIWILLIMLFPLIGTLLYIILSNNMKRSKVLKNINENIENGQKYLIQDEFIKKEIEDVRRLLNSSCFSFLSRPYMYDSMKRILRSLSQVNRLSVHSVKSSQFDIGILLEHLIKRCLFSSFVRLQQFVSCQSCNSWAKKNDCSYSQNVLCCLFHDL